MPTLTAIQDQLEEAAAFARAGDVTAAVARARAALESSSDDESRAEARLALARLQATERVWRAEVERRARQASDADPSTGPH